MRVFKQQAVAASWLILCAGMVAATGPVAAEDLTVQEIDHGALKSIALPASWVLLKKSTDPRMLALHFSPSNQGDAWVDVDDTGVLPRASAIEAFHQVLALARDDAAPVPLKQDQLKEVSPTLGFARGDNQYTNSVNYPDQAAPLYRLLDAEVTRVNGKAVVRLTSSYMDQSGKPTDYELSMSADSPGVGSGAVTVTFGAADEAGFAAQKGTFETIMKSVVWAN